MKVTCPRCRALADRTYDSLFWLTSCPHCGYELEEVNVKEALEAADIAKKGSSRGYSQCIGRSRCCENYQ